jgi:hypothetical protein
MENLTVKNIVSKPRSKFDENSLINFESMLDSKFPESIKDFIKNTNGGMSSSLCVIRFDGEEKLYTNGATISSYHGFGDFSPDFEFAYHVVRFDLPKLLVPFAVTGGGNKFLISLRKDESYGKIYYCDHEVEADDEPFDELTEQYPDCMVKVAESFEEMVSRLEHD